jgi:hypothetical protein
MSQNIPARQQLNNAIPPLVCFSIIIIVFAFAGQEILMSLLEEDPVDAQNMQVIMVIIFGVMLLGFISQFAKAYKRFETEKNAPPRPVTPAQPAENIVRAREMQREQFGLGSPQATDSSVTYSTAPVTTRPAASQPTHVIQKETIIKEVVKIRCSYCGGLADQGLNECPNCGGRL